MLLLFNFLPYVIILYLTCLAMTLQVFGSFDCCLDGDACLTHSCPPGQQCFDLPPPAPITTGYTCGQCPNGTELILRKNKCEG